MTRRMNAKKISKSILALLITVPALLATNAMAQELKKPTLEDLIPGGETYHKPENKSYQWWGDAACLEPVSYTHLDVYKRQKYIFEQLHLTTHPLKMLCMDILSELSMDCLLYTSRCV